MTERLLRVTYSIEEAHEKGLKALEKDALKQLRADYEGDWKKARIIADIEGDKVTYTVKC